MKKLFPCIYVLICIIFISCGEDRSGEYYAIIAEKEWIEEKMREVYLWNDEIPDKEKLTYLNVTNQNFFSRLLPSKDKFSKIEISTQTTKAIPINYTYGFEFELKQSNITTKYYFARVLYVLPNSPADRAGLKRGDWISAVNEEQITTSNKGILYSGGSATFTLNKIVFGEDDAYNWVFDRDVEISSAEEVESNPVFLDTIYQNFPHKTGYLIYNNFFSTSKVSSNENEYTQELKEIIAKFKSNSIDNLILDLRYNSEGDLYGAQVLSSLLVGNEYLGKPFCSILHNENLTSENELLYLDNSLRTNNLNLNKLYIITSDSTAYAAEILIHGLSPYMDIKIIGSKTAGKYVITKDYETPEYPNITLHPVVAAIYNADAETFTGGISPDFTPLKETAYMEDLYPLGDIRETLLKNAISVVKTGNIIIEINIQKEISEDRKELEKDFSTEIQIK